MHGNQALYTIRRLPRRAHQIGVEIGAAVAIGIIGDRLNRRPWSVEPRRALRNGCHLHIDQLRAQCRHHFRRRIRTSNKGITAGDPRMRQTKAGVGHRSKVQLSRIAHRPHTATIAPESLCITRAIVMLHRLSDPIGLPRWSVQRTASPDHDDEISVGGIKPRRQRCMHFTKAAGHDAQAVVTGNQIAHPKIEVIHATLPRKHDVSFFGKGGKDQYLSHRPPLSSPAANTNHRKTHSIPLPCHRTCLHPGKRPCTAPDMLARLIPDRFILILLGTIALASMLPVRGGQVAAANIAASAAVFIIFFLHGIKLSRAQVITALTNWRVHLALSLFIFGVMPLAGLGLSRLLDHWMAPLLAIGLLYIGVLPTTVQSATTYTSLAHGNTAISVVASALNNLVAIIITPLLFAFLAGRGSGVSLSGDLGIKIAMILLLPFFIGQSLQRWLRPWVLRHPSVVRFFDQGSIAVAVYVAFSAAVVDGIWYKVPAGDFAMVGVGVLLMLIIGFGGAWAMGGLLRLDRADRIATLFAGAHKSIAVGAPMAALLFPAGAAGMVLLPILLYHLLQLMISAWLAPVLARSSTPEGTTP